MLGLVVQFPKFLKKGGVVGLQKDYISLFSKQTLFCSECFEVAKKKKKKKLIAAAEDKYLSPKIRTEVGRLLIGGFKTRAVCCLRDTRIEAM